MSPEHIEVVVAPRSFDRSISGTITGRIWFEHQARNAASVAFPEREWSDFPVIILGWWLQELGAFVRGERPDVTCEFMDGAFECRISRAGATLVRVRCVGRYLDGDREIASFVARERDLFQSVGGAAAAALAECDRRRWSGRDVEELRDACRSNGLPRQPDVR